MFENSKSGKDEQSSERVLVPKMDHIIKAPNRTGQGVQRSKRPLLAYRTRYKYSLNRNLVKMDP